MSLRADVFSYKRRELRDLFRRQLGRCHLLDPRADRGCLPHPAPVPPDALLGWQTRVSSLLNCCTERIQDTDVLPTPWRALARQLGLAVNTVRKAALSAA